MAQLRSFVTQCALGLMLPLATACSAEADIPRVVLEQNDLRFQGSGVPDALAAQIGSRQVTTEFDHPDGYELPDALHPRLYATRAVLLPTGNEDLSFIEELTFTLGSRAENAPEPRSVAHYQRSSARPVGNELELETDDRANVLDFWDTKKAYYRLTAVGSLPTEDWTVDIRVEFRGSLEMSP
jgi:hypothetical protein